jgi:predicted GNAT superfamily acetyltransferase
VLDLDALLALNRESESMLSPLDREALAALVAQAYYAVLTPGHDAMLIALDHNARYDSPNFAWFKARYDRFVYVDRIAVSVAARGRGIARALYDGLIARAAADGHEIICAEIYADPPNAASDAFHASCGFVTAGSAFLPDRGKSVRYVTRSLR